MRGVSDRPSAPDVIEVVGDDVGLPVASVIGWLGHVLTSSSCSGCYCSRFSGALISWNVLSYIYTFYCVLEMNDLLLTPDVERDRDFSAPQEV